MFLLQRYRYALLVLLWTLPGIARADDDGGVHLRFSLASEKNDAEVEVSVSGKVTDVQTGKGIENALVRGHIVVWRHRGPELFKHCPREEVRTDKDGKYELRFVTPLTTSGPMKGKDSVCVDASMPGFETRPRYVKPAVSPDQTTYTDINIALRPGKLLEGTVVDEDSQPIPDALVRVQNGRNGNWNYFGSLGETRTDEKGRFELWCSTDTVTVIGNAPWLRVSKRGYGAEYFWDLLDQESLGSLTVPRGGTVRGKVLDTDGNPVSGCAILARDIWPNEIDETVTNEQGEYELRGIPGQAVLTRFYEKKNGRKPPEVLTSTTVYARSDPRQNLRDVPQYVILAKDGQTVTGPDLVAGANTSVSGKVVLSWATRGPQGLMVRLDADWNDMVETDGEGRFRFPLVRPGKHRLTAYLPNNLRGRGIGSVEVDVQPAQPLEEVEIETDPHVETRVQFVDAGGNPLEGITAGATRTRSGEGFWTEGTKSDGDGRAVLYLRPREIQFVRGFDRSGRGFIAEGYEEVQPQVRHTIGNLRIVMVPSATIEGRLLDEQGSPMTNQALPAHLKYADGVQRRLRLITDASGRFRAEEILPGVMQLGVETQSPNLVGTTGQAVEVKPGQNADLGEIRLRVPKSYRVSGSLVRSPSFHKLEGFKIRLDLAAWDPMVATDREGKFVLPDVTEGTHRLTAYLPYNLRTDRGVGHISIDVKDGDLGDVELQLEPLAVYDITIVDESGEPISGISAAAWWTDDHSGVFTEGTKSDDQGKATLHLYPDQRQYLGAHDWDGKYRLKSHHEVMPRAERAAAEVTVTMISAEKD
jgi:hypothetical protein